MLLTCKSRLKMNKIQFEIIDNMSFQSKSLYNSTLYQINEYFKANNTYLGFGALDKLMKQLIDNEDKIVYRKLPAQVAQQTLKKVDENFKSFFALLKKRESLENKQFNIPRYLPKDGRFSLIFQSQSYLIRNNKILLTIPKEFKDKFNIKFLEFDLPKYIKDQRIRCIEIYPGLNTQYYMSIVYEKSEIESNLNNIENWCSIDLGLNNIATVSSNVHKSFILNGKPIKSINQRFNKRISKLKSKIKIGTSKLIQQLYTKRADKLNNEIHKLTDFVIKSVKEFNIDTVVIGHNKEWKSGIQIGKVNNQNFVQIPFFKFISQLEYKLKLLGINLIIQEESYTSKTSFMDLEPVEKQETYKGKRIKRGLFKTSLGKLINADVNAALNIFRKAISKLKKEAQDVLLLKPLSTGLVMNPVKININTSSNNIFISSQIKSLKYFN